MPNENIQVDVKKSNMSNIIGLIKEKQPISRAQVSVELCLSRATVSSLVNELILKGLVSETGIGDSTRQGGRRSIQLGFNEKSRFCVGVNINKNNVTVLITDLDGSIEYSAEYAASNNIEQIISYINDSIIHGRIEYEKIIAIGISVPGITDTKRGVVVESPTLDWMDVHLADCLWEQFKNPIFVINDVDCLALSESWIGSAKNAEVIYFIGINNGLGSSLIVNGNLYKGSNFQTGEIGYTILDGTDLKDIANQFGKFGLLEHSVSGWALSKLGYNLEELFAEYAQNNLQVVPVVDKFIRNLSITIANSIVMLNPSCVIIGGEVAQYMNGVIDKICEIVTRLVPIHAEIKLSETGPQACNLGAIAYALREVDLTI